MNARTMGQLILGVVIGAWTPVLAENPKWVCTPVKLSVTETVMNDKPVDTTKAIQLAVSPDRTKIAYIIKEDGNYCVSNGKTHGKQYMGFSSIQFSPDGNRLMYAAGPVGHPEKAVVVLDGVESREYEGLAQKHIQFSSDSKHTMWIAGGYGSGWRMVYDGVEGPVYPEIMHAGWSKDCRRWSYIASDRKSWFQVIDGKPQKKYRQMQAKPVAFSPDGKRYAYQAYLKKGRAVVVDGKEYKGDNATCPAFSPDSRHVAFGLRRKGRWQCMLDGKPLPGTYDGMCWPIFTSDNRVAFIAFDKDKGSCLILDGKTTGEYYDGYIKYTLQASPQGGHIVFVGLRGGKKNQKLIMSIDGKPSKQYDYIEAKQLLFSPDGAQFAYKAVSGKKWTLIKNGGQIAEGLRIDKLNFSPDSRYLAYYSSDEHLTVMVDDVPVGRYYPGGKLTFSPDSRYMASSSLSKTENLWQFMVNGVGTKPTYTAIPTKGGLVFTSPDSFRIIAFQGDKIIRVDVKIQPLDSSEKSTPQSGRHDSYSNVKPVSKKDPAEKECKHWLSMAKNYRNVGLNEKAKEYLNRIIKKYPKTEWSDKARKLLKEIK